MSIINYDILQVAGFEQGTIGSMYDEESTSRVRSIGYMQMNPTTYNAILEATATTDKQVQVAFRGYSGTTPESLICNLYWYDSPKSFDLNSYQNLRYFRVVLKYSEKIEEILGKNGISIIRKIFGIILLAIAIQIFTANIKSLF